MSDLSKFEFKFKRSPDRSDDDVDKKPRLAEKKHTKT